VTRGQLLAIVDESEGVAGYHLNGDIAEWDSFPEVEVAHAALAQQPAPAVPEGWKLVPVEPTVDMAIAAAEATGYDDYHEMLGRSYVCYRAMLAAAPAAPELESGDLTVWRITLSSGEQCHFGTENMAIAWGRGDGKVERVELKAPPMLEVVPVQSPAVRVAQEPATVKAPRALLKEAIEELEWFDRERVADDAMGLRATPPRVSRLLDKLRALLGKESEDHE
jgi:hypothetical protein